MVHLSNGRGSSPSWTGGNSILSEVGTLQLEFAHLAKLTGDASYAHKVNHIIDKILEQHPPDAGLFKIYIHPGTGRVSGPITYGALGDSFYEYLLKMWLLTNKKVQRFREVYDRTCQACAERLVQHSSPSSLTYIADLDRNGNLNHKMDHLVCFAGGMFHLGAQGDTAERDKAVGAGVTETCHEMYARMATGISAEYVVFQQGADFKPGPRGQHYLLRPEAVESFFVLWRQTGDPKYREWGWQAFQAIEKHCRVENGYSGIRNVDAPDGGGWDDLESQCSAPAQSRTVWPQRRHVQRQPLRGGR